MQEADLYFLVLDQIIKHKKGRKMPQLKTLYSMKWEEQFAWLLKAKEPDSALCTTCNKVFRIDGGELAQVRSHQKSKSHREKEL